MMQLGEMLVREGALSPADLEEALGWQVLYGGRLGTNLLELGLVDERTLAEALGRQHGCEWTFGEQQPSTGMVALLPAGLARRHEVVPWKVEERRLKVLTCEPGEHMPLLDELGFRAGTPAKAVVAPEFRVHQLLRRHFGSQRPMRALDFGVRPRAVKVPQPNLPVTESAELMDEAAFNALYNRVLEGRTSEPTPPPTSEPGAIIEAEELPEVVVTPEPEDDEDLPLLELEPIEDDEDEAPRPPARAPAPTTAPDAMERWNQFVRTVSGSRNEARRRLEDDGPLSFPEAVEAIDRADGREAVARAVLRYARSRASRAVLLSVQGEMALGWQALGDGLPRGSAHRIALPLSVPGSLRLVRQIRSHYLGPLPREPGNEIFFEQLGGSWPASAVILPILFRERVTHLLYADAGAGRHVDADLGELLILAQRITRSMEELVARRRAA